MDKIKIKKCAIVLGVTGKFEKKILKSWKILKKINIRYVSLNHYKPHIAVTAGDTNDIDGIILTIKKMNIKKFSISSPGLGIFANQSPNLHIRWNLNDQIIKIKNKIDFKTKNKFINFTQNTKIHNWVPKTTLAWKDLNYYKFSKIYKLINFMFNSDILDVKYIYVIDFTNKEIIKSKIKLKS